MGADGAHLGGSFVDNILGTSKGALHFLGFFSELYGGQKPLLLGNINQVYHLTSTTVYIRVLLECAHKFRNI